MISVSNQLMALMITLLCCYYKSFPTEPTGHHLPKYLYIYKYLSEIYIFGVEHSNHYLVKCKNKTWTFYY